MIETVGTTAGFSELPSTSDPSTIGSTGGFSNCYSSPYYSDDSSMDGKLGESDNV